MSDYLDVVEKTEVLGDFGVHMVKRTFTLLKDLCPGKIL